MSKPLVLLTGGTGHIGFATLIELLKSGYRVRLSSRSSRTAEKVLKHEDVQPYRHDIEAIEVKNMLEDGAFTHAVKDVNYIVHLASPIPDGAALEGHPRETMIEPALRGTMNMMTAAHATSTVKRVVMASSVAALAPKDMTKPIGPSDLGPKPDIDSIAADDHWGGYAASKLLAHLAATEFMDNTKTQFDLVLILPSYVQGRNGMVSSKQSLRSGSNDVMMDLILGKANSDEPRYANTVLVDDVAEVLARALRVDIGGKKHKNLLAAGSPSGRGIVWDDVPGIVEKLFPDAVKEGKIKPGGNQASLTVHYDVSETEEVFGIKFKSLKEQVLSLVGQYLTLAD